MVLRLTLDTGECLPALVRRADWVPVRTATRYPVRHRRFACIDTTLDRDLRGIALLYEWAETTLQIDLDKMLERFEMPLGRQLESLIVFLRRKTTAGSRDYNALATVAIKALSIRSFLMWAADPANQGSLRRKPIQQLLEERMISSRSL